MKIPLSWRQWRGDPVKKLLSAALLLALAVSAHASPPARVTLLFAGDMMAHSPQLAAARRKKGYDFGPSFAAVAPLIRSADLAAANLETTLGGGKGGYTGYPCFSTPDEYADAVKGAGIDVLTTANNHCMDRRFPGLKRTVEQLTQKGFSTCGTYAASADRESVLIREVNGLKIAFLSWTYGTNGIPVAEDKKWSVALLNPFNAVSEDMARARALSPDFIVALPHIGTEYALTPPRHVTAFVEKLLAQGANAVIASHPHVVQPFELRVPVSADRPPALIAWSMGNFISNQRQAPRDMGVMARLTLERSGDVTRIVSADVVPTWVQTRTSKGARVSRVLPLTQALRSPARFQISAADLKRLKEAHADFTGRVLGKAVPLKEAQTAYALTPSARERFSTAAIDERVRKRREAVQAGPKDAQQTHRRKKTVPARRKHNKLRRKRAEQPAPVLPNTQQENTQQEEE